MNILKKKHNFLVGLIRIRVVNQLLIFLARDSKVALHIFN